VEASLLLRWAECIVEASVVATSLAAAAAAQAERDAGAVKLFNGALAALGPARETAPVETGVLAHLDERLASALRDTQQQSAAKAAKLQALLSELRGLSEAAGPGLERRTAAAAPRARELLEELGQLRLRLAAAERRAETAESLAVSSEQRAARAEARLVEAEAESRLAVAPRSAAPTSDEVAAARLDMPSALLLGAALQTAGLPAPPVSPTRPQRQRATREPVGAEASRPALCEEELRLHERVLQAARPALLRWDEHERAWAAFAAAPPACIAADDIPWPPLDALEEAHRAGQLVVDARKLRQAWHPDRFAQRFGARVHPAERDAVMRRVTEAAARLNALSLW